MAVSEGKAALRIFAETVQNPFIPLSYLEFWFWPQKGFSLKMKMFHSKVFTAENPFVC